MTGSGTLADPYVIWDINDLQNMGNAPYARDAHYELGCDIDAAPTAAWNWDAGLGIFKGFEQICNRVDYYQYRYATGDHSSGGAWIIFPADGIMWDKINEVVPDEDARYIQATLNNDWALFNLPAFTVPSDAVILSVGIVDRSKVVVAGTSRIRAYLRVGGGNYQGSGSYVPGTAYSDHNHGYSKNPKTGLSWTVDEVNGVGPNALEAFGVIVTDAAPDVRVTQVYIRVRFYLPFRGNVDGKGYTIDNLYINRPGENVGLFGYLDLLAGNEIKNINMTHADITGYGMAILCYACEVGDISGVHVQGKLTGDDFAGLVNYVLDSLTLSNCTYDIEVIATGSTYGGGAIAGGEDITATDVTGIVSIQNTAGGDNTIGGFFSDVWGTSNFIRCSVEGSIYAEGRGTYGGFGGYSSDPTNFNDCHSNCEITIIMTDQGHPGVGVGGFIGFTCWNEQFTDCSAAGSISVTANGNNTKGVSVGGFIDFTCTHERLTRCRTSVDITVTNNGVLSSAGIGGFIDFSCATEEFTECAATGNINFTNNGSLTVFNPGIGGFVGFPCDEEIYRECYSTGNIVATMGTLAAGDPPAIGGFAGGYWGNDITFEDCYSLGDVTMVGDNTWTAGFIGQVSFFGVPGKYIKNCYSKGKVSVSGAGNTVGGCIMIEAPTTPPPITAVFWDIENSGQTTSDGGVGKTTAEMKDITTFDSAGWDIEASTTDLADGYPFLSWQLGSSPIWLIGSTPPPVINKAYALSREEL